jgi:hypothetical protein
MLRKRRISRLRRPLVVEYLEDRTLLSGNVLALQDPVTGVLTITGDTANNHITLSQPSPGVLRVAGDINIPPPPGRPDVTSVDSVSYHDFVLATVTAINVEMLDGTDRVTMMGFSIPGNITITAGSGVDTFSLSSIQTNAGIISITATGSDTVSETDTVAGSSRIVTGDGPATIVQTNVTIGVDTIVAGNGNNSISITNSTDAPPPRSYAIGQLSLTAGNGNNSVTLDQISVGPTTVTLGNGNNSFTFDDSTIQQASVNIGNEVDGAKGSNSVDISRDTVTGSFLDLSVLNESGISGSGPNAAGGGAINTLTMNNVQFTASGNLNVRIDDGIPYYNRNGNKELDSASTVLMELIDTGGDVNVDLGDHFQLVQLGNGTVGLNDIDANNLSLSVENDVDVIVVTAIVTESETVTIGDVSTYPIPPLPAPSVLINGSVGDGDDADALTITIGNNNNSDLGSGWPITVSESVQGSLAFNGGNGLAVAISQTQVSDSLSVSMGNGGPGNTESLILMGVTAADVNLSFDSNAADAPDGNPNAGVIIYLIDVDVTDPSGGLDLTDIGEGADIVTLTNVTVVEQLTVSLSSGINTVLAQNVTTAFGMIDGGSGPSNLYVDRGGDFGYVVFGFVGQVTAPNPPQMQGSNLSLSASAVNQGDTVTLTGSFTQPGNSESHTVTINWGDGSPNTVLQLAPGVFTFSATHQYLDEPPSGSTSKVDTIAVAVTDSASDTASASTAITVNDVPPAIPANGLQLSSSTVNAGSPVTLTGSFVDPDSSNPHQVVINWGDGSTPTSLTVAAGALTFGPISHTYQTSLPGNVPYTIQVTISDEDNTSASASVSVTVIGGLPSGSPTGSELPGLNLSGASHVDEGASYTLDLSSLLPAGNTISSVTVTWGDGQVQKVAGNPSSVTHVYNEGPNNYTILAKATDQSGTFAANNSVAVQVMDMPPPLTISGPTSANPESAYTLNLSASDPGTDPITGWTINWGDGTTDTVIGNPSSVSHTYALEHHTYTISAQATNGDGTFTAGNTVTVNMAFATADENFLSQVYLDLLGRPLDPSGLQSWTEHLQEGASRDQVVLWITQSLEYRTLEVEQLYQTFLGRPADAQGLRDDVVALGAGVTTDQIKAEILGSDEYFALRASGSMTGFFSALYMDVLGRSATPSEIQAWILGEPADASRTALASLFVNSMEANKFFVQGLYQKYLHRSPDSDGLNGFIQSRGSGATEEDVIAAILGSDEYFQLATS